MSNPMNRTLTIRYSWTCAQIEGDIPSPLSGALEETAEETISEALEKGQMEGELVDNVNIDVPGVITPEGGFDCVGSFTVERS